MVKHVLALLLVFFLLAACSPPTSTASVIVDDLNTPKDESFQPGPGEPTFPDFGDYWIIDVNNACGFSTEVLQLADQGLDQLQKEGYAEVAIICINGVKNPGFYAADWLNWQRLGNKENQRSLVWLIRPDADIDRVYVTNSYALYQNTAVDYAPNLDNAAAYADLADYDGALESIVRDTNQTLRKVIKDPGGKP